MRTAILVVAFLSAARAQQLFPDLHWRNIGPFRGGRTRAAAGVPSQPNLFYMGQVNGGVWKSDDYGRTWIPVFEGESTQSIGAIAVAPSNPAILYVASGEGLQRPDLSVGDGIYRSSDAGKSWTHLGLRDGRQIPALAVDPRDPNRLFAAVLGHPYGSNQERGIFRSTDGGRNWDKVLYVDENTGASDVALDPSNSDVVYACLWEGRQGPWEFNNAYNGTHGGLFKSTDGGATWRKAQNGLPPDVVQCAVSVSPARPSRLYASVASKSAVGLYRSDDAGETWMSATADPRPATRIGGGDLPVLRAAPKNPDIVYSASTVTWRSGDAGKTWTAVKGAPGGDDYQNIWINPDNPDIILLVGDQGAVVSVNGGSTWSSWYNQPTAQMFHGTASNSFPYRICGGQQESGSVCIASRGNDGMITMREWRPAGIIEYGYAAPDPLDPEIVYGAGRGQVSKFHWSTGQVQMVTPTPLRDPAFRADRTQPILFSPVDPHVLFYAANLLFKSIDGAKSWQVISPDLARPHPGIPSTLGAMAAQDAQAGKQRGVIYSLAASFKNLGTIWAGTDDGLIWVTRNGGRNWKDVTPPGLTPWSKVTQMEASHFDDNGAYASVSRFRLDDLQPYVYRTRDGGKTWQLITAGLPADAPMNVIREDPTRKGLLFAGSETSVWVSFDDGDRWQPLQLNLPHTSMRDLCIHGNDLIVTTHGRSYWILDDITPLRQINESLTRSDVWLFRPAPAYRVRRSTNTDTPLPPDEPSGENPPDGAIIDYFLRQPASAAVTIEVLDGTGKLVRRYSSTDKPDVTDASLSALAIPPFWVREPRILSAAAGIHRWVWDLHYAPPESLRPDYPISAVPHRTPRVPQGPRALPGLYTVRLTVDGRTLTAPLTIQMDPRVKTSLAGLQRQFNIETKLAAMMNAAATLLEQARANKAPADRLSALTARSVQISALYAEIDSADAAPTAAQVSALATLQRQQ